MPITFIRDRLQERGRFAQNLEYEVYISGVAPSTPYRVMQAELRCRTQSEVIDGNVRQVPGRHYEKKVLIASGLGTSRGTNPIADVTVVVSSRERGG